LSGSTSLDPRFRGEGEKKAVEVEGREKLPSFEFQSGYAPGSTE